MISGQLLYLPGFSLFTCRKTTIVLTPQGYCESSVGHPSRTWHGAYPSVNVSYHFCLFTPLVEASTVLPLCGPHFRTQHTGLDWGTHLCVALILYPRQHQAPEVTHKFKCLRTTWLDDVSKEVVLWGAQETNNLEDASSILSSANNGGKTHKTWGNSRNLPEVSPAEAYLGCSD